MASKMKLAGSFGSLMDTLSNRFDPLQPEDIVVEWTDQMVRCAAIARDVEAWNRLPEEDDRYDPIIRALDRATRALVNADYSSPESVRDALRTSSQAIGALEGLLAA